MSFPKYPAYKDSGVEWLGQVPDHWEVGPVKRFFKVLDGLRVPLSTEERSYRQGNFPYYGASGIIDYVDDFIFDEDMVLVSEDGANLLARATPIAFVAKGRYWVNNHAHILKAPDDALTFWSERIEAIDLTPVVTGAAQPKLTIDALANLVIAVPPTHDERKRIARFVETELTRIDALVAEQEQLITLLKEKRQAVISHAVTKGLGPSVPMKDSGVEWLGEVPAHWGTGTLTRVASRVVVGIAEAATHAYVEQGVPILRSTNIRAGRIVGEILHIDPIFAKDRGTKEISAGDLVTVRTGNAGVTAVVPKDLDGCQCFTMLITTLLAGNSPAFYCYWMNGVAAQHYFSLEGWGTAQVNISVPILKTLPIPIPPASEQSAIVGFLDREVRRFDELTSEAESVIETLRERRTALISAAVTGQIDVRGLASSEAAA